jgi:hypothetical protein
MSEMILPHHPTQQLQDWSKARGKVDQGTLGAKTVFCSYLASPFILEDETVFNRYLASHFCMVTEISHVALPPIFRNQLRFGGNRAESKGAFS